MALTASHSTSCSSLEASRGGFASILTWTRPRTGARLVLALAVGLLAPRAGRCAGPQPDPLPWRAGGRLGFTVDAVALPESAGTTLAVYLRVPPATLAALTGGGENSARLRVTAGLRGAYGGARIEEQIREFALESADSARSFGKVVGLRFAVRPARYRLTVRLEDVLRRRRRSLGRVTTSARVEGEVLVAPAQLGRALSDIEFLWTGQAGGAASVSAAGMRAQLPNPERLYGLLATELEAAFVADGDPGRAWRWTARVRDGTGRVVAVRESAAAAAAVLDGDLAVDLATEPAGDYALELEVRQEGDTVPVVRRATFSVAWQMDSWLRNPREIQDEVHFLLGPDEEDAFALLSPGAQERYLDDFWRARDPSPQTGENEARRTFRQRIAYANEHFSRAGLGKGMFSDMGRVYVRYGAPSEIVNQVIPSGDETLDQMIADLVANDARSVGDINMKGPGGDQRAFELWTYEGPVGQPPDVDPTVAARPGRRRLMFLFVDERGVGDYRLRYSTE